MQHPETSSGTGTAYQMARAAVQTPEAIAANRSVRTLAWSLLKAERGQTLNQTNLNSMPMQGFGR